jgi:hypothetical protein
MKSTEEYKKYSGKNKETWQEFESQEVLLAQRVI